MVEKESLNPLNNIKIIFLTFWGALCVETPKFNGSSKE